MGVAFSFINQGWPPKSTFSVGDIPDLSGKVIIVTGGNVGTPTSQCESIHCCPKRAATKQAIEELKRETDKEAIFLKLDLSDLKAIKAAADEFQTKEPELHVLFNNAGVMMSPVEQITTQGHDLQFGTNVLDACHFYFTNLLLPQLLAGVKSSTDGKARVVNTSSAAAEFTNTIDFDILKDTPKRRKTSTRFLYPQSKLGNVLLSNELARRYGDQGIVSTSISPGNIQSSLSRHMGHVERLIFQKLLLWPTPYGALTQLYAGTTPAGGALNGKHLIPWARVSKGLPAATPELGNASGNGWKNKLRTFRILGHPRRT